MSFTHSFSATGTSPEFYAGRGGFDWSVICPNGETISVTIEQEVNGSWYTKGSAVTATAANRLDPVVDYTPSGRFRINCGTYDSSAVVVGAAGDIFGVAVTESLGLILEDSYLLENGGDSWLQEDGSQWLLENA